MVEVVSVGKNIRISAKKVRPVVGRLLGVGAQDALATLRFAQKKAATPLTKVIKSAIANATHNQNLDPKGLVIKEITVDEGPTLKRIRPVSRGAAHPILKRSSHIKVVLEAKD